MLIRRLLTATFAFLAAAGAAHADPPRPLHEHWRNTNYPSHYVLYDNQSRTWVETVDCRVANRFTQVSNENNTLNLFDASRGMAMRLTYEGMFLKAAGASDFTIYQYGTFDTRTLFEHSDANGAYTGSIVKRDACAWEEWFPGGSAPSYRFVQSAVSPDAVEIYDGSRDIGVRLEASRMLLRQGNTPFSFFRPGRWH